MITVEEWENRKVKLQDELFEPVFKYPGLIKYNIPGNRLLGFIGKESGILLEPNFTYILEFDYCS